MPFKYRDNKKIVLDIVSREGDMIEYASEQLKNDFDVVIVITDYDYYITTTTTTTSY